MMKYPLDSIIQRLNNWTQEYKQIREIITGPYLNAEVGERTLGRGGVLVFTWTSYEVGR